ncbi:MAG TPA: BON domain-containing protein, partial [Terriglobales bacterium]|nr:BON domain-containing protein [Terriglobales bacterium]
MKPSLVSTSSIVKACFMLLIGTGFVLINPTAAGTIKADDAQLAAKLTKSLQDQLTAAVVDVQFAHGVATLTGTVGRLSDRILAEEIAHGTPGVTVVRDDIELIPLPISDKELAQQLSERIHYSRAEAGFTFPNVKLTVKDGVVTATGDVNDYLEHAMARSIITSNDGVKRLDDQLHIVSTVDPDEETRIAVAKALEGEPVQARVEFGVVHLMGSVP